MNRGKLSKIFLSVFVLTILSLGNAPAGAVETPTVGLPIDTRKYMFLDEVKPGMKGYGLTVFSGTTIEKFDAEIISVIYNVNAQGNLILVRVSGGPIERTGVIAGMSGSPIYINDRIIGALAFSWPFSKEPIAGITPINEMLRIFEYERRKGETQRPVASSAAAGSNGWTRGANFGIALPASASESAAMQPIMTPMVFSGFSREAVEFFRPQLQEWGIVPVLGGSSAEGPQTKDVPFEEGAAIGVQLIRGDLMVSAIGTVTVREGDRVLAFGHPFMLAGSVDYPMTTAYIHTVLPSLVVSSKVGSALKPVGALTQDRATGVMGVVGGSPKMIPLTLSAQRKGDGTARTFHFEVARSRQLLPILVGIALADSLNQAGNEAGDFAAKVHYEIELEGYPTIRNEDFLSGMGGFPFLSSLGLVRDLNTLVNNQFTELSIRAISVEVEVIEAIESARVTSARLQKDAIRPGEDIALRVIMKPYMKDYVENDILLHIPEHFPEGQAFLQISAAPQTAFFERMRAPSRFQPDGIERLVQLVDEDYPGNRLDIRLLVTDPGLVVKGREMPALPSSVFSVISQTMGKEPMGITMSSVMLEKHIPLDFEVEGSVIIPVTIDRKAK